MTGQQEGNEDLSKETQNINYDGTENDTLENNDTHSTTLPDMDNAPSETAAAQALQQQMRYLIQEQQLQLQKQQRKAAEYNIKEYPLLKTLLPEEMSKFLTRFAVYEESLKQGLELEEASIFRCKPMRFCRISKHWELQFRTEAAF